MSLVENISSIRSHWDLAPDVAFLNHGSFGACPRPILELQSRLRAEMEAEPVQFLWRRYEERLEPSRQAVANFVGAPTGDVVFVTNATTAVNAVLCSLHLGPGDELLTTEMAYNACLNACVCAGERAGTTVRVVKVPFPMRSEEDALATILDAVTPRTRLAFIDHVTSNSALVLPIERIVRELQIKGVDTLVDGAHAPGMVPLDLERLRPAYYTGNLHKWVCAPKGAAFLYVRPDKQEGLQPAVVSHGNNTPRQGYNAFQDRFDWAGTFDPTAWMCAGEAIRWMGSVMTGGWRAVMEHNNRLVRDARTLLCERLEVVPPCPEGMLGSMATLPLPDKLRKGRKPGRIDPLQIELYDRFRVEVPIMRFGSPEQRWIRISAQVYNELNDYERLAGALSSLVA